MSPGGSDGGPGSEPPTHRDIRDEGEARHGAQRHQDQEHPRQEGRHLRHRGLRPRRQVRQRDQRDRHRAQHQGRHPPLHGAGGSENIENISDSC